MNALARLLSSWGYVGLVPFAPGTAGSLVTVLLCWLSLSIMPPAWGSFWFASLAGIVTVIGYFAVHHSLKTQTQKDPSWIVIDEVAGQTFAFSLIAPHLVQGCHWMAAAGFVLFRLFDITKPFGIKNLEKLPGAWGVMADDLLAGAYAAVILLVLQRGLLQI